MTAYTDAMGDWGLRTAVHEVDSDDTLPLISLRYYASPSHWDVLVQFNGLSFSDALHDGDRLVIPEPLEKPITIPPEDIPMGRIYHYNRTRFGRYEKPIPIPI